MGVRGGLSAPCAQRLAAADHLCINFKIPTTIHTCAQHTPIALKNTHHTKLLSKMMTSRLIMIALAAATFLLTPQSAEAAILPRSEKTTVERMQDGAQDAFKATKNGVREGLDAVGLDASSRQKMASDAERFTSKKAGEASTTAQQTMGNVAKEAERKRQDAATAAHRMATDGSTQAQRAVHGMQDSLGKAGESGMAEAAMRSASNTGRAAKEGVQDAATSARRAAEDAATSAGRRAEDAKDAVGRSMPEL